MRTSGHATSRSTSWLVFAGLLSSIVSFQLGQYKSRSRVVGEAPGVMVMAVQLKFNDVAQRDAYIAIWRLLAEEVRTSEPSTFSYGLSVADDDPTKVLLFERFRSRADYQSHRGSAAFLRYKVQQAKLPFKMEVSGQGYEEYLWL